MNLALCFEGYVNQSDIVFEQTVHKGKAVKSASGQTTVGIDPQVMPRSGGMAIFEDAERKSCSISKRPDNRRDRSTGVADFICLQLLNLSHNLVFMKPIFTNAQVFFVKHEICSN